MKNLFCLCLLTLFVSCSKSPKMGYINIKTVFDGFEYKKEMEKEFTGVKNARKYLLDSLQANLRALVNRVNADKNNKDLLLEYQKQREFYLDKKSIFEEEEATMVRQFDEKIIKQLNSYVKSYGRENNYSVIYGATANGSIMYGDSTLDLSQPVIEYINKKYKGK